MMENYNNNKKSFISHKYGVFDKNQFEQYKQKLRKKLFWLILYTDKNTNAEFKEVDVISYHKRLINEISGLNSLLYYPMEMAEILVNLEMSLLELQKNDFNFNFYKKTIFDTGDLILNLNIPTEEKSNKKEYKNYNQKGNTKENNKSYNEKVGD